MGTALTAARDRRRAGIVLAAAAIVTGLMAGLYYAYAVSVMPGLSGADDPSFVEAVQRINQAIENPVFFTTFLGAIVLTGAAAGLERRLGARRVTTWIAVALTLYALGVLTTIAINVPLNEDLAKAGDPSQLANVAGVRDDFQDKWVVWNVVRTVLSTVALACLAYALLLHGQKGPTDDFGKGPPV